MNVAPGSDIQAAVNAHPAGTAFCLKAGVHYRASAITPRTGNSFTGEYGAVVDGSRWSTADQNQGLFRAHNQNIDDVTIRNLVLRNAQQRAIHAYKDFSDRWIIENNEIHGNRVGISHGNHFSIRRNLVRNNWQYGIVSFRSTGSTIEDNEFAANASRFAEFPGDAGTSKWALVTNTTVRRNVVRDNSWNGIWFDSHHVGILIEGNILTNNGGSGIFHEAGGQTIIRANTVSGSLRGIYIANSRDTDVDGNLVRGNQQAIALFRDANNTYSDLYNNLIRRNTIRVPSTPIQSGQPTWGALISCINMTTSDCSAYSTSRDNRFRANEYWVPDTAKRWWFWNLGTKNWSEWQGSGQDTIGSVQQG